MNELAFTYLENQVLDWLLGGEEPVLYELRQQLCSAKIKIRKYTGVGFYLYFDVPGNIPSLESLNVKSSFCFGDVEVLITDGDHKQRVGFLLWIRDGYIDSLEAYTYGDEKWPEKIEKMHLRYIGEKRDFNDLRQIWAL